MGLIPFQEVWAMGYGFRVRYDVIRFNQDLKQYT